jgi:hypothetical protein
LKDRTDMKYMRLFQLDHLPDRSSTTPSNTMLPLTLRVGHRSLAPKSSTRDHEHVQRPSSTLRGGLASSEYSYRALRKMIVPLYVSEKVIEAGNTPHGVTQSLVHTRSLEETLVLVRYCAPATKAVLVLWKSLKKSLVTFFGLAVVLQIKVGDNVVEWVTNQVNLEAPKKKLQASSKYGNTVATRQSFKF